MPRSLVRFLPLAFLALLAACAVPADVDEPQVDMGNFHLGYNIVVVNEPEIGPFSRKASDEEWKEVLTEAIDRRFGGYDGDKLYHIGIKVDAYALAVPGIPLVFTPNSVLVLTVSIWDDATGKALNEEPKAFTVFEGFSGETVISSGLTQTRRQQMTRLANNAAKMIQDWILENPEWVGLPPRPDKPGDDTTSGN